MRRSPWGVILIIGFALLLSACSSGGSGSSASSSATSSSAAAAGSSTAAGTGSAVSTATKGTVNVGFLCTCTGFSGASNAISYPAYEAWVDDTNAHGGLNGYKINLIFEEDNSNPTTTMSELRQLVQSDHVIAIVGNSLLQSLWPSYLDKQHVPVIGMNPSQITFGTNENFFSPSQTQDSVPLDVALAAKKAGKTKIGLFYCAEAAVCEQTVPAQKAAAGQTGTSLVFSASVSASASSYTAQCLAAEQAGANAVVIYDATTVVNSVVASCTSQGYHPTWLLDDAGSLPRDDLTSALSSGVIATTPVLPVNVSNNAQIQAMLAAVKQYQPSVLTNSNYNEQVVESWAAGLLLQEAAQAGKLGASGTPTADELFNGLYSLKPTNLGGLAPEELSYKQGQANPISCFYIEGTSNGQFTTPYGTKPFCPGSGT
jgi:branched-chain amino acid transport system substrate-binding protein